MGRVAPIILCVPRGGIISNSSIKQHRLLPNIPIFANLCGPMFSFYFFIFNFLPCILFVFFIFFISYRIYYL
jgi:hypothetical protein